MKRRKGLHHWAPSGEPLGRYRSGEPLGRYRSGEPLDTTRPASRRTLPVIGFALEAARPASAAAVTRARGSTQVRVLVNSPAGLEPHEIQRCRMPAYLVQINVRRMSEQLSRWLGCPVSASDVRELLRNAGFSQSPLGWITSDVRPCLLAYLPPGSTLF